MAQADQTVQNATFPTVRADINDNLAALFSQSSGNSAPAVTVAFMPWIDTSSSPAVWKVRNAANSDWITIGTLDASTFSTGGVTAIANGGTGQTTAAAALTALLPSQTGNSGKALITDGTTATWDAPRGIVRGTDLSGSTSVPELDFTGIPSWVKRITVMFRNLSTNGTSPILIRLSDSSGFATTGYESSGSNITTSATAITGSTTGLILQSAAAAAASYTGNVVITNILTTFWTSTGLLRHSTNTAHSTSAGSSTLGSVLTGIRITTVGGTNTFDDGVVNIMYEG